VPPPPTETVSRQTLFEDDFSQDLWGTLDDSDNVIDYDGEALRMRIFRDNWFLWSAPEYESYENIHAEITVVNNDGAPNTAFGIMCHQQESGESYYYLVVTPSGEYTIGLSAEGQTDVFLTNNDEWGFSDLIPEDADSYRVGADCGNGVLTLYVNGTVIDSASDSTYSSGGIGLVTWSGYQAESADASFDDLIVTSLE
jgi:hypothetical protein